MENMEINHLLRLLSGRKILVTGHTGFKGSWLTIWLLKIGAKIIGYSLPPRTPKDNYVLSGIKSKIKEYLGDIRDKDTLFKVFRKEKPEIIFHLAAQPIVIDSYKLPHYTVETNVIGTTNIVEAFRRFDCPYILVVITTDKVYENYERKMGYKENDRLGGYDLYSASKASTEIIVNAYKKSFFNNNSKKIVTVRAGNIIGGGDWSPYRIVPDCIKSIEKNVPLRIRNPLSVRPWQFVLEPLFGYILLASKLLNDESNLIGSYNFGPNKNNHVTVESLVKKIIYYYGNGSYIIDNNNIKYKETNYLALNTDKAKSLLGWNPKYDIDKTVKKTVEWYLNYKNENIFDFCINQIKEYEDLW